MEAMTPREIGEPERRGVGELRPFRYQPAYAGAYTGISVAVYDDKTDVDLTSTIVTGAATMASGVITSGQISNVRTEQVLRVHFRFSVDNRPYDEYRRVIVEK
jgi:hypothetical protein